MIIEGEANHPVGSIDLTITYSALANQRSEWQLVWRFFTPQQILLSAGLEGGFETEEQAFREAENIFLMQVAKSEALKDFRKREGWKSLH